MTRAYRPDAKPDGPLTPAFREIPERPEELPAKRTRRPKGPPDEIDRHIAAIQTARHEVRKYQDQVEHIHARLQSAYTKLNDARAELSRLTAGLTPSTETETANPEE